MGETFSDEFKKSFLILFTRELLKHSIRRDIIKLQRIIGAEERKRITRPPLRISPPFARPQPIRPRPVPMPRPVTRPFVRHPLFIPEPRLPPHLEYLKPLPTPGVEIDLWKLNPLIKDPGVRILECNPDERVIVTGSMGTKPTDIILTKEDINQIISRFSEFSRIPAEEGVYRVVGGNLILSAIISDVISSRFIIKKIPYSSREYPTTQSASGFISR